MAQLPIDTRLKIEKEIEDGKITQGFRPYLGMSGIGDSCSRKLWYGFRCCANRYVTPRQKRLLERGNREEEVIKADLIASGVIVHGEQTEVSGCSGHMKGHIDDLFDNLPDAPKTRHLGEYKTSNDKNFKDLVKKGVKKSKPVHYAQMVCYMSKLKLTRALYIAVNKNDDSRYYERIAADEDYAQELFRKATDIIRSETPPKRIGSSTWYECKWCDYYEICHFNGEILKHCRTCEFADLYAHGVWKCSLADMKLAFEQQLIGCPKHKWLEGLKC